MNIMNLVLYQALLKDMDEAREKGREEGRKEARREYEEWLRKVAIGCLKSGVDPDIVCKATGYTPYRLMNLMDSEIS